LIKTNQKAEADSAEGLGPKKATPFESLIVKNLKTYQLDF
jgi:hypothetical protein